MPGMVGTAGSPCVIASLLFLLSHLQVGQMSFVLSLESLLIVTYGLKPFIIHADDLVNKRGASVVRTLQSPP